MLILYLLITITSTITIGGLYSADYNTGQQPMNSNKIYKNTTEIIRNYSLTWSSTVIKMHSMSSVKSLRWRLKSRSNILLLYLLSFCDVALNAVSRCCHLRNFLSMLESCGKDAVAIASCFVSQKEGFAIYSDYCTNYPKYVSCLTVSQNS